jgi:hypothetical protein
MARSKRKDPVQQTSITMTRSVLRTARAHAAADHLSFSALVTKTMREYLSRQIVVHCLKCEAELIVGESGAIPVCQRCGNAK